MPFSQSTFCASGTNNGPPLMPLATHLISIVYNIQTIIINYTDSFHKTVWFAVTRRTSVLRIMYRLT